MIQVTVKVYSILRAMVGKPAVVVQVPDNSSVKDVLKKVIDEHKNSFEERYLWTEKEEAFLKYLIILLNGKHVSNIEGLETKVREGDTVDFMEPLIGG